MEVHNGTFVSGEVREALRCQSWDRMRLGEPYFLTSGQYPWTWFSVVIILVMMQKTEAPWKKERSSSVSGRPCEPPLPPCPTHPDLRGSHIVGHVHDSVVVDSKTFHLCHDRRFNGGVSDLIGLLINKYPSEAHTHTHNFAGYVHVHTHTFRLDI